MTMTGDQIKASCKKNGFEYDLDKFRKRILMIHFDNNTNFYNTQTVKVDEKGKPVLKDGIPEVYGNNGYIQEVDFENELIWFKEVNQQTYIDTFKAFSEIQGLAFFREDLDPTDTYAKPVPVWAKLENL